MKKLTKNLILPFLILISAFSILIFSNFNTTVKYYDKVESGERELHDSSYLRIEGYTKNYIYWSFNSTTKMKILLTSEWQLGMISKYYPSLEIEELFYVLRNCIISESKYSDSGVINSSGNGLNILIFKPDSEGMISFRVEFDPLTIEYMNIPIGILGILLVIAVPFYFIKFVSVFHSKNQRDIRIHKTKVLAHCKKCGYVLDDDAQFCHECGNRFYLLE